MSTSESFEALRRSNPRSTAGFAQSVDAVRAQIAITEAAPRQPSRRQRAGLVRLAAVGAALTVAAGVAAVTVRSPGGGPGVEDAAAEVRKAATVTTSAAERSGTAAVRITHDGELWAGSTIRWYDGDLSVSRDAPDRRGRAGAHLLLVGGTLYGVEEGHWVIFGDPGSIDPGSGTTPDEYAAAVREDVGGMTLRRIAGRVTGLTVSRPGNGSTVYRGQIAAGVIARETGFKEGEAIRVLPFGYVAHDEAANASALLDVAVTVGADGVARQISVSWGTWDYTVTYGSLGSAPALKAPKNARDLVKERLRAVGRG
ncbi:MAG: hypothetical protein ACRDMK_05205 [Gaiellaceae bacterium]